MSAPTAARPRYRGLNTRDLALIALFAALLAALSIVPGIPVGPAPVTLQTLGVVLAPSILGWKRGTLAVVTFLTLGAAGLPIFSGGQGGLAVFVGATGGFLVSWILVALFVGVLTERMLPRYRFWPGLAINITGGLVLCYLVGVPWMGVVAGTGTLGALQIMLVFVPGDIVKAVLATAIATSVHRAYPVPPAGNRVS